LVPLKGLLNVPGDGGVAGLPCGKFFTLSATYSTPCIPQTPYIKDLPIIGAFFAHMLSNFLSIECMLGVFGVLSVANALFSPINKAIKMPTKIAIITTAFGLFFNSSFQLINVLYIINIKKFGIENIKINITNK